MDPQLLEITEKLNKLYGGIIVQVEIADSSYPVLRTRVDLMLLPRECFCIEQDSLRVEFGAEDVLSIKDTHIILKPTCKVSVVTPRPWATEEYTPEELAEALRGDPDTDLLDPADPDAEFPGWGEE